MTDLARAGMAELVLVRVWRSWGSANTPYTPLIIIRSIRTVGAAVWPNHC